MKDPRVLPGFIRWVLPGFIGGVIGFLMAYIIKQINIVVSFPARLKTLKTLRGNYAKVLEESPTASPALGRRFREISEMVESGSAVNRFNFFSRYWRCKEITSLIKRIEMHQSLLLLRIGVAAAGKTRTAVEGEVHVSMPPVEEKEVSKNCMDAALPVPAKAEGVFMDAAVTHSWNVDVEAPAHSSNVDPLRCAWTKDAPPRRILRSSRDELELSPAHGVSGSESEVNDEVPKYALSATEQKKSPRHAVSRSESEVNDEVPKHARSATEQKEAPARKLNAHAMWELDAPEVPTHTVSEVAVELEKVDTTNRGSHCRGGILDLIKRDLSGRNQLASLEDLAMEIRSTIPLKIKKGRIKCTSDDNGSVVEAWTEQLDEVLGRAYDMNKKYKDRFIYNPKARKRISCLTSEINTLLKLGQVNVILQCCFNH